MNAASAMCFGGAAMFAFGMVVAVADATAGDRKPFWFCLGAFAVFASLAEVFR